MFLREFQIRLSSYMFFKHCKYNNVNKITLRQIAATICSKVLSYLFMYNVSLVPCNSFNSKPIFKYIYLPKLVSTEQVWSTICTNTLLAEIYSQYKLWFFKIHHPSPISRFIKRTMFFLHS